MESERCSVRRGEDHNVLRASPQVPLPHYLPSGAHGVLARLQPESRDRSQAIRCLLMDRFQISEGRWGERTVGIRWPPQ